MLTMQFSSFWDIFAIPFGYVMQGFNYICGGHYALSLLLFAFVVKLLTLPLAISQQKNQIKGAMLRPKMMLIEKKYAGRNDRPTLQKKQQELMELQQKEGYSPLSGCLPMLIQFPIIIALYRIIRMPLKYVCNLADATIVGLWNAYQGNTAEAGNLVEKLDKISTYGQIELVGHLKENPSQLEGILDASKLPNFSLFGKLNLGIKPQFNPTDKIQLWLLFIPVLCCALSYLSMWISRKLNDTGMNQATTTDQKSSMLVMNLMMPLMSLWIAFIAPAAVGLYWVYTSLLGILQTVLLAKIMPLPRYTEEEIRMIQKEMKGKNGQQARTIVGTSVDENGKPKSLHYTDDDDEY